MRAPFLAAACLLLAAVTSHAAGQCVENPNDPHGDGEPISAYLGACRKCADAETCAECWPEFGVASNGTCVPCAEQVVGPRDSAYCATCDGDDPSFCYKCYDPYGSYSYSKGLFSTGDGGCGLCDEGCVKCNGTAACTECARGFGLVGGMCQPCTGDKAERCDGDPARATKCKFGWSPDPQTGACFQCPQGCYKCSSPTTCEECEPDLGLDPATGACVDNENCRVDNCIACTTSLDACTGCRPKYTLVDGKCVQCPEGCRYCEVPTKCLTCNHGMYDDPPPNSGPLGATPEGTCVPCSDPGCLICGDDARRCEVCKDGFRLEYGSGECLPCTPPCKECHTDSFTGLEWCDSQEP